VLTKTVDGYFPDEDHFVVIFSEDCIVDNVFQAFFVTVGPPHESFRVTFGSFFEAFSVWILTQTFENGANCAGEPLFPFEHLGRSGIQSKEGGFGWPAETVGIWNRAVYPGGRDCGVRGGQAGTRKERGGFVVVAAARSSRFERINIFISKVWMEFIYGIVVVVCGAEVLGWNILKFCGELKVLKAGGEEV